MNSLELAFEQTIDSSIICLNNENHLSSRNRQDIEDHWLNKFE